MYFFLRLASCAVILANNIVEWHLAVDQSEFYPLLHPDQPISHLRPPPPAPPPYLTPSLSIASVQSNPPPPFHAIIITTFPLLADAVTGGKRDSTGIFYLFRFLLRNRFAGGKNDDENEQKKTLQFA